MLDVVFCSISSQYKSNGSLISSPRVKQELGSVEKSMFLKSKLLSDYDESSESSDSQNNVFADFDFFVAQKMCYYRCESNPRSLLITFIDCIKLDVFPKLRNLGTHKNPSSHFLLK